MKLPRLQLHLSTCIVLMFTASGLMWVNFIARDPGDIRVQLNLGVVELGIKSKDNSPIVQYGWPSTVCAEVDLRASPIRRIFNQDYARNWNNNNLALNIASALAILAVVAFVCEWILRRSKSEVRGTK